VDGILPARQTKPTGQRLNFERDEHVSLKAPQPFRRTSPSGQIPRQSSHLRAPGTPYRPATRVPPQTNQTVQVGMGEHPQLNGHGYLPPRAGDEKIRLTVQPRLRFLTGRCIHH
jgi:hypothetical protein